MSKVLVIFEARNNTTDNNLLGLTTVLSRMNAQYKTIKASHVSNSDIEWCDVCIANRPNSLYSLEILKTLKKYGRYCIISLDDDLLKLQTNHPFYWKRIYTIECLIIGDALMSTSPLILEEYVKQYKLRPVLTRSFVSPKEFKNLHHVGKMTKIVYAAGKDHLEYFDKYLLPFFDDFVKEYEERVDITFIGVKPNINHCKSVHFINAMPYKEYLDFMEKNDFDIGLAPLPNSDFCSRKYFAKYIEYGRYGILGIYSNVKPYTFAIRHNENGILVGDSCLDWRNALVRILNNPLDIMRITSIAQKDLRTNYSLDSAIKVLREMLPEIENFHAVSCAIHFKISVLKKIIYNLKSFYIRLKRYVEREGLRRLSIFK